MWRAFETAYALQRAVGNGAGLRYLRFWFFYVANSRFKNEIKL